MRNASQKIGRWITDWLTEDGPSADSPLCDFKRRCYGGWTPSLITEREIAL